MGTLFEGGRTVKDRKLSRRDFLLLSGGVGIGTLLAACGPAPTPEVQIVKEEVEVTRVVEVEGETIIEEVEVEVTAPPPETVEIRFDDGSFVGPEGLKWFGEDLLPRFETENPGIKVVFESAEAREWQDKVLAQMVAGTAPDVMYLWQPRMYDFMMKEQLLAIDDFVDATFMERFYPAVVRSLTLDGRLMGVPKGISCVGLAYNKDILDESGVDYPDETWDWDDYYVALNATTKRDSEGEVIQWGTHLQQVNYSVYQAHWVWENGGEWMNKELLGDKCLLNEEKALEAVKFIYDFIWGPEPVAPQYGSLADLSFWSIFQTGKVAFHETHSWTMTRYMKQNDFHWDLSVLPTGRTGIRAGIFFPEGYFIYAGSKHPHESVELLKFLASPWAERARAKAPLQVTPASPEIMEWWATYSPAGQAGHNLAAYGQMMEKARVCPYFKDAAKALEIDRPIWEQIFVTRELGVEEGVNLLCERINGYFGTG
jgi:multiple sugar transport system substrate-binding protein